jgi:hypothetical protein
MSAGKIVPTDGMVTVRRYIEVLLLRWGPKGLLELATMNVEVCIRKELNAVRMVKVKMGVNYVRDIVGAQIHAGQLTDNVIALSKREIDLRGAIPEAAGRISD